MADLYGDDLRDILERITKDGTPMIGEILELVDREYEWGQSFYDKATADRKKEVIRRALKELRHADGCPKVLNLTRRNAQGDVEHYWKQEELFSFDDYQQACAYYVSEAERDYRTARLLAERCRLRYGNDPMPPLNF